MFLRATATIITTMSSSSSSSSQLNFGPNLAAQIRAWDQSNLMANKRTTARFKTNRQWLTLLCLMNPITL